MVISAIITSAAGRPGGSIVLTIVCMLAVMGCSPQQQESTPTDEAKLEHAERLMQVGRYEDAAPFASVLVADHPHDWRVHDLQARVHLRRAIDEQVVGRLDRWAGHIALSVDAYAQAVAAAPDLAGLHRSAAGVAQSAGQNKHARAWYARAIELDGDHPRPWFSLAQLIMVDDPWSATQLLQRAVVLEPNFAEAHASLAVLAAMDGHAERAEAAMSEALAISPDDPAIRLAQARMYRHLGEHANAVALLSALDEASRTSEPHTWEAARSWEALGRMDRVGDAWSACLVANAHRSDAWRFAINAARARVASGDLPAASALLEQAEVLGASTEVLDELRGSVPGAD